MQINTRQGLQCSVSILCLMAAQVCAAESIEVLQQYQDEIADIKARPRVQLAMEYVESVVARAERELVELTEIPAPPFGEENRARRFAEMLREAGLDDVVIDAVGNVVGRRPGQIGKKVVAYSGHLDTVFPAGTDVTVKYRNGKMYAPGIADNTRGLINVLDVLRALQHAEIKTLADVLFIGNVGEEGLGDLRGVKHLFREGAAKIDTLIAIILTLLAEAGLAD